MLDPFMILAPLLLLPVVGLLRFIGCTPFSADDTPATVGTIKLTTPTVSLAPGEKQTLQAQNASGVDVAATWSGSPNINATTGVYTAPSPFNSSMTTETITGTSTEAATKGATANATITLVHIAGVTLSPSGIALVPGNSQTFTQSVQGTAGHTPDQTVIWSSNAPGGKYTAPNPYVAGSGPVTITATSKADPSIAGTATVILLSGNTGQFVSTDVINKGTWQGIYGIDGYALAASPNIVKPTAYLPSLNLAGLVVHNYGDPTMDVRGLQKPPTFAARFANAWIDTNALTVEIDFGDFAPHRVAIYFVDWDTANLRKQTVELRDAQVPSAVLDTRSLANFDGGLYVIWNLTGHILVRITKTAGPSAVMSGIFFG